MVRDSVGTSVTVTGNVHELARACASVAVHDTVVDPIGNVDPDAGVHATVTGACPPEVVGAA
jgi:hypothetical protein